MPIANLICFNFKLQKLDFILQRKCNKITASNGWHIKIGLSRFHLTVLISTNNGIISTSRFRLRRNSSNEITHCYLLQFIQVQLYNAFNCEIENIEMRAFFVSLSSFGIFFVFDLVIIGCWCAQTKSIDNRITCGWFSNRLARICSVSSTTFDFLLIPFNVNSLIMRMPWNIRFLFYSLIFKLIWSSFFFFSLSFYSIFFSLFLFIYSFISPAIEVHSCLKFLSQIKYDNLLNKLCTKTKTKKKKKIPSLFIKRSECYKIIGKETN